MQQSPVPLQFPLPDVAIATDATPPHQAFYFQGSGLPLSVSGSWSGSMCRAHIALQELQAVAMMLHRIAFHLPGKVAALHLDKSIAKDYLCNQSSTVSPFQVGYVFPSPVLIPLVLCKFLAEHVKGQLRQLILVAPCWMEAPWLPIVLNMLADIPQQ